MHPLLPLAFRDEALLVLGQAPTHGTRQLRPQIERQVFLLAVEETQLCSLVRVDDRQHSRDGFS